MCFSWEPLSNYLSASNSSFLFLSPSITPPHIHSLISSTASLLRERESERALLSVGQDSLSLTLSPSGFHLCNDDNNDRIKQRSIKISIQDECVASAARVWTPFKRVQFDWKHFKGKVHCGKRKLVIFSSPLGHFYSRNSETESLRCWSAGRIKHDHWLEIFYWLHLEGTWNVTHI